jgi:hypothetical protein
MTGPVAPSQPSHPHRRRRQASPRAAPPLRHRDALGEFGPVAILRALRAQTRTPQPLPSPSTIANVLKRHALVGPTRRLRRPPPSPGWHIPQVAPHWTHRLVRCEVNLRSQRIQCFGLRRSQPAVQSLLATYHATSDLDHFAPDLHHIAMSNSAHARRPNCLWTRPIPPDTSLPPPYPSRSRARSRHQILPLHVVTSPWDKREDRPQPTHACQPNAVELRRVGR